MLSGTEIAAATGAVIDQLKAICRDHEEKRHAGVEGGCLGTRAAIAAAVYCGLGLGTDEVHGECFSRFVYFLEADMERKRKARRDAD